MRNCTTICGRCVIRTNAALNAAEDAGFVCIELSPFALSKTADSVNKCERRMQDLNLRRDCSLEFSKLVQLTAMRILLLCTRTELNCHQGLRKPLLYPLSYGCKLYEHPKLNRKAVGLSVKLRVRIYL